MPSKPGFVPLASSVLTSEPDIDINVCNLVAGSELSSFDQPSSCIERRQRVRRFSFSSTGAARRSGCIGAAQDGLHNPAASDEQLERILLQPLHNMSRALNGKPNVMSLKGSIRAFEALDPLEPLINKKARHKDDVRCSELDPVMSASSTSALQASDLFQMEADLFSSDLSTILSIADSRDQSVGRLVSVHELAKTPRSAHRKDSMHVKVIPSREKPAPVLTPRFSRKIATKAVESKNRARLEKQYYSQFLRKLCRDEVFESEEEDDEIFDIFGSGDDMGDADLLNAEPKTIPSKELMELFGDVDVYGNAGVGEIDYDRPASYDNEFLEKLNFQLDIHLQLLVQNLALSGEICNADHVWVTTLKMMIRLDDLVNGLKGPSSAGRLRLRGDQGVVLLQRILKQSPLHEALLTRIRNVTNDPDLRIRATVSSVPFKMKGREGRRCLSLSKSFWHILSLFGDSFDPNYSLTSPDSFPDGHQILSYGRRADSFSASEDRILLLGLKRFGFGNWEKIQSQLLPTRSARQLSIRYKNLATRRAPDNPVKSFVAEVMKPLSKTEEVLLVEGYRTYGGDWMSISARFLPHRPASVLKRLWLNRRSLSRKAPPSAKPEEVVGEEQPGFIA